MTVLANRDQAKRTNHEKGDAAEYGVALDRFVETGRARLDRHRRTGIFAFCSGMLIRNLVKVP
jgi:hypothetical protein